jgi:hypothetical protein
MKTPRLICLLTLTLGVFLCQRHAVAAVQSSAEKSSPEIITERRIPVALSAVLCERQAVDADFISNGVFDAQIKITALKPKNSASRLSADIAKKRALELAVANEQLGYAYGVCEDGSAWVGTFPGPAGVELDGSELRLPSAAKTICAGNSLKVLFVSEQRGRSMTVPLGVDLSARLPGQKGYVSVSCVPKRFPNSGPREWALIPTGGAGIKDPELVSGDPLQMSESLLKWINEKRNIENLLPYSGDQVLGMAASGLSRQKVVHHDLTKLANVKIDLLKKGIEPLGEDRAAGRTLGEIAGLLWRSPGHRDLLLNPSGQLAGIAMSAIEDGQLMAVVLIARKPASGAVAKHQK